MIRSYLSTHSQEVRKYVLEISGKKRILGLENSTYKDPDAEVRK